MKLNRSIGEKEKLDAIGIRKRSEFLCDYTAELQNGSTAALVKESYSSLFDYVLGSSPYMFISVRLESTDISRALDSKRRKAGGVLPDNFIRLGREYYASKHSGTTTRDALEGLWNKLIIRVNYATLGSAYKRYGQFLRWVGVHENSGKRYATKQTNHLHALLEVPARYSHEEFEQQFCEQFSWLVYPVSSTTDGDGVLNIKEGRLTGTNPHPEYIQKQLINWETASDRVFMSGARSKTH